VPRQLVGITALLANIRSLVSLPFIWRTARVRAREPANVAGWYRFSFLGFFSFSKYRRVMWLMHSSGESKKSLKLEVQQCGLLKP
jgi:hypothetical protein